MKIKLIIGLLIIATACGGSSGSALFLFRGLWLASLSATVDTCSIANRSSGGLFVEINQREDVVTAFAEFGDGVFNGFASGNSFAASNSSSPELVCPDGQTLISNVTSTLEFSEAGGDIADFAKLSFFFDCPGFENQCELSYQGSSIRLSGSGNTSGEVLTTQMNENPLF